MAKNPPANARDTGLIPESGRSPEDIPDPGVESGSLALQANSLPFELQGRPMRMSSSLYR